MDYIQSYFPDILKCSCILIICLISYFWLFSRNKKNNVSVVKKIHWADDITGMNGRPIERLFKPHSVDDICRVIQLAKKNNKKISMRGQGHTMGGQTIIENGYIMDMENMNKIIINK